MIKRTLCFSNPVYLRMNLQQMELHFPKDNMDVITIAIEDIGFLILEHPQITITHSLIQKLQENNVAIITCNEKHMPYGLMLPLVGHSEQMQAQRYQLAATDQLKNNLWKQTIVAKIKNQSIVAYKSNLIGLTSKLEALIRKVNHADKTNVEGHAAALYWSKYNGGIIRDQYGAPPNHLLNYGYTILRSMVARALVGAGLLPTVGIHHKNKYNPFCFADDIMEPFRPFVDLLVLDILETETEVASFLTQDYKERLLSLATMDGQFGKKVRPLMVGLEETAASVRKCFEGNKKKIIYPIPV